MLEIYWDGAEIVALPQSGHREMSISNTRFKRCAQVSGAVGEGLEIFVLKAWLQGAAEADDWQSP